MKRFIFGILIIVASIVIVIILLPSKMQDKENEETLNGFEPVELFRGSETIGSVLAKIEDNVLLRLNQEIEDWGQGQIPDGIKLVALKEERILQVYGKRNGAYSLFKTYPFTGFSGKLGPKLREGDRQIPEGIYRVEFLNPNSSYHLSIKLNFPNQFDWQKARLEERTQPGSEIFIHGKSVTIGCIPIGDLAIEELFYLVQNSINSGVEVIISPRDFRVNPEFPIVENVNWVDELYEKIKQRLSMLPLN